MNRDRPNCSSPHAPLADRCWIANSTLPLAVPRAATRTIGGMPSSAVCARALGASIAAARATTTASARTARIDVVRVGPCIGLRRLLRSIPLLPGVTVYSPPDAAAWTRSISSRNALKWPQADAPQLPVDDERRYAQSLAHTKIPERLDRLPYGVNKASRCASLARQASNSARSSPAPSSRSFKPRAMSVKLHPGRFRDRRSWYGQNRFWLAAQSEAAAKATETAGKIMGR